MSHDDDTPRRPIDDRTGTRPTDPYDRELMRLTGRQAVTKTSLAQFRSMPDILGVGQSTTYSVTTYREAGDILDETDGKVKRAPSRFTSFVEIGQGERNTRIVLPDAVLAILNRQRDSLTTSAQRRAQKAVAQARKAAGLQPGFMKGRKRK